MSKPSPVFEYADSYDFGRPSEVERICIYGCLGGVTGFIFGLFAAMALIGVVG